MGIAWRLRYCCMAFCMISRVMGQSLCKSHPAQQLVEGILTLIMQWSISDKALPGACWKPHSKCTASAKSYGTALSTPVLVCAMQCWNVKCSGVRSRRGHQFRDRSSRQYRFVHAVMIAAIVHTWENVRRVAPLHRCVDAASQSAGVARVGYLRKRAVAGKV